MTALLTAAGKRNKFTDRDQQEACQFIFEELSKEGPPGKVDASDISECDPSSDTGKGIKGRYYKFDLLEKENQKQEQALVKRIRSLTKEISPDAR